MTSGSSSSLIPVTLLTGFLGSGKTTLLNRLVTQEAFANTLIIINEFGEMALDHLLVAHSTENVIMEMSSGCVCCTIRGDLVKTLKDITWRFARQGRRQFDRVLIETTGLADPAPIIHTLMTHAQIAPKYRLDGVIALFDFATGAGTLDRHQEAVKQAAMADVLLLTKGDLVSGTQRDDLLERLRGINPAAARWEVRDGDLAAEKVIDLGLFSTRSKSPDVDRWIREDAYRSAPPTKFVLTRAQAAGQHTSLMPAPTSLVSGNPDPNRHDDHIRAFCFTLEDPIPEDVLNTWLEVLMSLLGSNILRVKGILNLQGHDRPTVLHGVQHIFHPPVPLPAWPSADRRSRLVFITQDVDRDVIETIFKHVDGAYTSLKGSSQ
jgi:G3E family GTPase